MTGFASGTGQGLGFGWSWDIRSVNARGLDVRCRVPDWISGLEQGLKAAISKRVARGNISVSLRIQREEGEASLSINEEILSRTLEAIAHVEARAAALGLVLAQSRATDILSVKGISEASAPEADPEALAALLLKDFTPVLESFLDSRGKEGGALAQVLDGQIAQVESLTRAAASEAEARREKTAETLRANLQKVLENTEEVDPDRVAQELALIAVKSDVTEEIDRLHAHVGTARALLAQEAPSGRKLDFLMQEFNREANTLCSKAQSAALTAIGLDLKAVIDQMREQVQNVE
ncbi:YicC family protein [Pseudoruegeria sp. SHC-113]|nr:YicC family protein [Pseudoruegeria sp. SHC-113]